MQKVCKLGLLINIVMLLILLVPPSKVEARWPPFDFEVRPSYQDSKIIYTIQFLKRVKWPMYNVTFKFPLPEGTRFLEASAQETTTASFDGVEITFFSSILHEDIEVASFVVEVVDPTKTVFTTRAWVAWEGEQAGNLWTDDISIDISRPSLDWPGLPPSDLRLGAVARADNDVITYMFYPAKVSRRGVQMQDLKINVVIPEGTNFLSADAPPSFVTSFDGQQVSFSTLELPIGADVGPLIFQVSTEGVSAPYVTTHAWATWKNTSRKAGRTIVAQEQIRTGDIVVDPHASQRVISDIIGDVPYSYYDLTSLTFEDRGSSLKLIFHASGNPALVNEPVLYEFLINSDCNSATGKQVVDHQGFEYRIRYRIGSRRASVNSYREDQNSWFRIGFANVNSINGGQTIEIWLPYDLINGTKQFCWAAISENRNTTFNTALPNDTVLVDEVFALNPSNTESSTPADDLLTTTSSEASTGGMVLVGNFISSGDIWRYLPGWSEPDVGWNTVGFDDSNWYSGPTSIGYGSKKLGTNLSLVTRPFQSDDASLLEQRVITQSGVILAIPVSGSTESVFMRSTFTVTDSTSLRQLRLKVRYEGGFIAYLNGVEVVRRGFDTPDEVILHTTLAADRESGILTEVIDLSPYITNLVAGSNVLAIQAHRAVGSSNLSINPQLTWAYNPANSILPSDTTISVPVPFEVPSITDIRGKIAVPIDNGRVAYDIHVFSVPDGEELATILNARQPNFRFDGQRLLINREGSGVENVYEYNLVDWTEQQVSDAPRDSHPFYDPWGNRVVYGNPELTVDNRGTDRKPYIFVQCSLLPPHQETDPRCYNLPWLGILVPAGQMGEIQGTHPVWTIEDKIAYRGCNTWAGSKLCGIYAVPSSSTKAFSDGFIPRQLTRDTSDTPSDTKDNLIAFSSQRDGDWEAYVMDLNGNGVKNLSNSPSSNDGLPTVSPDGNWVAFVSDRGGQWAIWVVPVLGGSPQKLFDLPSNTPWGDGDRAWINERISWGP